MVVKQYFALESDKNALDNFVEVQQRRTAEMTQSGLILKAWVKNRPTQKELRAIQCVHQNY